MHTYKLDTINYKDGEFHVKFIPNSEPIEFVVSGKNSEKFFDALKAIDYKTDGSVRVSGDGVRCDDIGVRPALRLRRS